MAEEPKLRSSTSVESEDGFRFNPASQDTGATSC